MSETVQPRKDQMRTVTTNYIIPPKSKTLS